MEVASLAGIHRVEVANLIGHLCLEIASFKGRHCLNVAKWTMGRQSGQEAAKPDRLHRLAVAGIIRTAVFLLDLWSCLLTIDV